MVLAILVILLGALPGSAEEADDPEQGATAAQEAQEEEHAEEAEHQKHGEAEGHSGRPHHKNDIGIFLGLTDEHGHPNEPTLGLDYKRRVAKHWAIGGLFDYAGGDLRNMIVAASVTWWSDVGLTLTAAPGIEFHRGRSSNEGCGCAGSAKSEEIGEADKDARYFLLRLGAGWGFPIGQNYVIEPQVNLDLVEGEKVWVYGVNFIYAW
jgi:hypothetical protein